MAYINGITPLPISGVSSADRSAFYRIAAAVLTVLRNVSLLPPNHQYIALHPGCMRMLAHLSRAVDDSISLHALQILSLCAKAIDLTGTTRALVPWARTFLPPLTHCAALPTFSFSHSLHQLQPSRAAS